MELACHHIEQCQLSDATCVLLESCQMWTQSTYKSEPELSYVAITQCHTPLFAVQSVMLYAELQFHLERTNVQLFHCIARFLLSAVGDTINKTEVFGRESDVFAQITIVISEKLHIHGIWIFVDQLQLK